MASPGIFVKLPQIVLGFVCFGITVYHSSTKVPALSDIPTTAFITSPSEVFYFNLVTFFCTMASGILFLSFVLQQEHHKKTFAELGFSLVTTILITTASLSFLIYMVRYKAFAKKQGADSLPGYGALIAAGVLSLLNSLFYAVGGFFALKEYRSG